MLWGPHGPPGVSEYGAMVYNKSMSQRFRFNRLKNNDMLHPSWPQGLLGQLYWVFHPNWETSNVGWKLGAQFLLVILFARFEIHVLCAVSHSQKLLAIQQG